MIPERPTPERPQVAWSRSKNGLETPLSGRIWRETRLIFAPPTWYDILTIGCLVFGAVVFFLSFTSTVIGGFGPWIFIWLGPVVFLAGLWGQLSSERMTCDLRGRRYTRREGQGVFKRFAAGGLDELDALVLMAELGPSVLGAGATVTYRLVLHWKGNRMPLLIVEQGTYSIMHGSPINSSAGKLAQQGALYARLLQIPFYDNSYYHSPEPLRAV
ncbi:MAG: hypothetical protein LCH41_05770 [Armatimonadetes bacterium]|nr:hypothetical protein [Armatimonadota bacterium]